MNAPKDKAIHPVDLGVGRNMRRLRNRLGISQVQLAAGLGVTFQQIQKYENGRNRISASKLFEAAQLLAVPIEELFAGLPPADVGLVPLQAQRSRVSMTPEAVDPQGASAP